MDLASVVAALASVGVRVSGSTPNSSVQVDSSRYCPTGLAGSEPSGTINDPGQHFHGDAAECYHSLTKVVQDDWFELMRVLGQRFDCISHEPVYLSRMLTLKESEFPRHADYVREFRTCVIKTKVNTSELQMGFLVSSPFVEGLSNDAVRRQYIVEVRSRWRSNNPFGFDTLVDTIAEAYIAAGYQLEEVQNASRTT